MLRAERTTITPANTSVIIPCLHLSDPSGATLFPARTIFLVAAIGGQRQSYPENSSARMSSSEIPEPMSISRVLVTIPGGPAM